MMHHWLKSLVEINKSDSLTFWDCEMLNWDRYIVSVYQEILVI